MKLLIPARVFIPNHGWFAIPKRYAGQVLPEKQALKIIKKYCPPYPPKEVV